MLVDKVSSQKRVIVLHLEPMKLDLIHPNRKSAVFRSPPDAGNLSNCVGGCPGGACILKLGSSRIAAGRFWRAYIPSGSGPNRLNASNGELLDH